MTWTPGQKGWVTGPIFDVPVVRDEIPRPAGKPYIPMAPTGVGVLHTTESRTLQSALASLHAKHSAPHFTVGEGRIVQNRPLGVQAAALVDPGNRRAFVQIEMVAFTGGPPDLSIHGQERSSWLPEEPTLRPLSALLAYLATRGYVALKRGYNWPDDCSDLKGQIWASQNNPRRRAAAYNRSTGWFYHLEVPGNTHYDCGAMRFAEILAATNKLIRP